jgi:hypothetical protein
VFVGEGGGRVGAVTVNSSVQRVKSASLREQLDLVGYRAGQDDSDEQHGAVDVQNQADSVNLWVTAAGSQ